MALIVSLNGSNYVSDKTKMAFEMAMQDTQHVKGNGKGNGDLAVATEPVVVERSVVGDGGQDARDPVTPVVTQVAVQPSPGVTRLLETVERGLAQSFDHQSLTLRVHEQYLSYQSDCARIFSQLMEQQGAIFANGHETPQQAASAAQVLDSLSRSMTRFHDIQTETLGVHKQFLSQQGEYARAFIELLQKQTGIATNANGHQPAISPVTASPPATPPVTATPVPVQAPVVETPSPVVIAPAPVKADTDVLVQKPEIPAPIAPAPVAVDIGIPIQNPKLVVSETNPSKIENLQSSGIDVATLTQSLLDVVSEKTGYPAEMLELSMDMEADLGIDSIKRVEILGGLQDLHPELPEFSADALAELRTLGQIVEYMGAQVSADAAPVSADASAPVQNPKLVVSEANPSKIQNPDSSGVDVATLTQSLLDVVSEKTGYPAEMLELSMDMEADLGIDSIKRVEILGGLQDLHPELPEFSADALADLRTLGQIVEYMGAQTTVDAVSVDAASADQIPADGKKKAIGEEPEPASPIQRREVGLRSLPAPDALELTLLPDRVCLVVDDGTAVSPALAQTLAAREWNVVLLRLPASLNPDSQPVNDTVRQIALGDDLSEADLEKQLTAVGPVGCFIHVNPPADGAFSDAEKARLKLAFLMAKRLKSTLNQATRDGRAAFVTVTRMDGALGLGQTGDYAAVDGGFGGLTKTLSLEWPDVFCRAVDVNPQFSAERTAGIILAELHDPNRLLVEVGHGDHGRVTVEARGR